MLINRRSSLLKQYLYFLSVALIWSGCAGFRTPYQDRQLKHIYVEEFKLQYFQALLKKGFNSKKFNEASIDDASNYGEPILSLFDLKLIDSLTTVDNQLLIIDSINSYTTRAVGGGKQIYRFALDKYQSKWLDKLSRKRKRAFWLDDKNFRKSLRKN